MARKLSEPMLRVLRIMAEGYEIEKWSHPNKGWAKYNYVPPPTLSYRTKRPYSRTIRALLDRDMIRECGTLAGLPLYVIGRYRLTEAGRRTEEEMGHG